MFLSFPSICLSSAFPFFSLTVFLMSSSFSWLSCSSLSCSLFAEVVYDEFRRLDEKMSVWNEKLHIFLDQVILYQLVDNVGVG